MIYLMWGDGKGELGIKDDSLWIFEITWREGSLNKM